LWCAPGDFYTLYINVLALCARGWVLRASLCHKTIMKMLHSYHRMGLGRAQNRQDGSSTNQE
jgi:hypothetical protein